MEFPRYVYRRKDSSPWKHKGVGYAIVPVDDMAAYDAALAANCVATHDELREPARAIAPARVEAVVSSPPDDSPPTRAEIIQMARKLGLKFGPRTSDEKLLAAINAAHAKG